MKKIIFKEVKWRNFLSYGNTWSIFNFNNGLNIIQGTILESGKSNGSGKSSITELVPFGLFGKTIKKIKKSDIINWFNGKSCEVRLKFTVDGVPYEVRRGIKPNKSEMYISDIKQPAPAHVAEFQANIEDIIGMDFQTFQNLNYFSPNNTISIINASKPEKRKFLESLFDLSVYSDMLGVTNKKISSNESKIGVLQQKYDSAVLEADRIRQEIDSTIIPDIKKYKKTVDQLRFQADALNEVVFNIPEADIESTRMHLTTCEDKLTLWETENRKSTESITLHKRLIESLGNIDDLHEKRNELLTQQGNLEYDICLTTEDDNKRVLDLVLVKDKIGEELNDIKREIQELEKRIYLLNTCIKDDEVGIKNASGGKATLDMEMCGVCGSDITEENITRVIQKEIEQYSSDLEAHIKDKDVTQAKIDKLNKQYNTIQKRIEEINKELKELEDNIEKTRVAKIEKENLQKRIDDLPDVDVITEQLNSYKTTIEDERKNCLDLTTKIALCETDIDLLKTKLERLVEEDVKRVKHEEKVAIIKDKLDTAVATYEDMKLLSVTAVKELDKKKEVLKTIQLTIDESSKAIQKANTLLDYLNYLKVSLKDENVKRFAISSLIPYLNKQANYYLSESGFPYIVTIDSWLDVNIRGLGVSSVSYGSLSGGETKCIDLSVQLACNDIASMMAKASLNLMVLDEILDSSVDSQGVQSLLNIIRIRQQTNDDAVYVITHRNELSGFTFDSIVRIIKEDGFSKIEIKQ